jgi:hypothetical protein
LLRATAGGGGRAVDQQRIKKAGDFSPAFFALYASDMH